MSAYMGRSVDIGRRVIYGDGVRRHHNHVVKEANYDVIMMSSFLTCDSIDRKSVVSHVIALTCLLFVSFVTMMTAKASSLLL